MFNASEATKLANEYNESRKMTLDQLLARVKSAANSGKYKLVITYEAYRDEHTGILKELGFAVELQFRGAEVKWE